MITRWTSCSRTPRDVGEARDVGDVAGGALQRAPCGRRRRPSPRRRRQLAHEPLGALARRARGSARRGLARLARPAGAAARPERMLKKSSAQSPSDLLGPARRRRTAPAARRAACRASRAGRGPASLERRLAHDELVAVVQAERLRDDEERQAAPSAGRLSRSAPNTRISPASADRRGEQVGRGRQAAPSASRRSIVALHDPGDRRACARVRGASAAALPKRAHRACGAPATSPASAWICSCIVALPPPNPWAPVIGYASSSNAHSKQLGSADATPPGTVVTRLCANNQRLAHATCPARVKRERRRRRSRSTRRRPRAQGRRR